MGQRLCELLDLRKDILRKAEQISQLQRLGEALEKSKLTENYAVLQSWREELEGEIQALLNQQKKVDKAINRMENPDYRTVMQLRYLCGYTWEIIAEKMCFSCVHVQRIHKKALEEFHLVMECYKGDMLY